jgi:hypothetical protein
MKEVRCLVVYDLSDPAAQQAAHRHRNLWGKLYTDIYALDYDHVALVFRPAPDERWRAWERVAEGARQVLADLLRYFKAEDDIRAMRRLVPAPVQENTGAPERSVAVWGNLTTRNITGGPARGDLEATLRYLEILGETTVVGEDAEGAA